MLNNKQQFNFFTLPFSGCCAYGLFMTDITNLPTPASRMPMSVQALPSNRPANKLWTLKLTWKTKVPRNKLLFPYC